MADKPHTFFLYSGSHAPISCPTGYYCPNANSSAAVDVCVAGYYCFMNATTGMPDGSDGTGSNCPPGSYCEAGTLSPTLCPNGTFSNAMNNEKLADCERCTAGQFCSENGLTAPNGNCTSGFYCPGGDLQGDSVPCDAGYMCPALSVGQTPCTSGFYQDETAASECKLCPGRYVCNATSAPVVNPYAHLCPEGYYCENGTEFGEQFPCPLGGYTDML